MKQYNKQLKKASLKELKETGNQLITRGWTQNSIEKYYQQITQLKQNQTSTNTETETEYTKRKIREITKETYNGNWIQ